MKEESMKIKSKKKILFLFVLSGLMLIVPVAQALTFSPTIIDISSSEIANPMRGGFEWFSNQLQPPGWPIMDGYRRYAWSVLEPAQGVYDFSRIDADIAKVQSSYGGRFGFRVMAAESTSGGSEVPQYLMNLMPGGQTINYNGRQIYAPDWNDPDFITRAKALIDALAAKYNDDPRVGWVEIGFYGDWAEWHMSGWPSSVQPMTSANKHTIIDYHIQAFTNKQIVSMKDDSDAFNYALSKSPKIGWRNDCFGNQWFSDGMNNLFNAYPFARDRWKTAPVVAEFCGGTPDTNLAISQVRNFHVSLVGMGNIPTLSSSALTTFQTLNKAAGYRLVLRSLTIPSILQSGQPFNVSSLWSNVNVAPFSMPWKVQIQLRNQSTGGVAWQGQSSLVFQNLFPTTNVSTGVDTPMPINDNFNLNNISAGVYDVVMTILDPTNYYKPLALAIQGRQSDGSYKLGQITVQSSTPTPSFSKCDQNHDTSINVLDLQSLANVILGKTVCTPSAGSGSADYTCDLNQDGSVNVLDLQYLANVILGKNSCP